MLDQFIYGEVNRISPESPVPVLNIKREQKMLGGAGNALANLAGLDAKGHIIAVTGHDEDAKTLQALVQALGFSANGLVTDAARRTIVKTRYLAGHQQLLRSDREDSFPLDSAIESAVLEKFTSAIQNTDVVLVSDYGKGLLSAAILSGIFSIAQKAKIPVIVDPKGSDFSKYRGAFAVTPNKKELAEATGGMPVQTDEDIIRAATHIIGTCGITHVIATRSSDGLSVISAPAEKETQAPPPVHIPGADIEVFDVSGAGDTVIATFAACLAQDTDMKRCAELANLAGSIVVTKTGTAPIHTQDLLQAIQSGQIGAQYRHAGYGIVAENWQGAAEHIRRWQAQGKTVGFTNGCFDILHYGHVSYLRETRAHCDRLVVGLNSDTSVKILKGESRPVHDENSRAAVLSALGVVDMVVLFGAENNGDDNTACALIERLQPDIYFKGGDYTESRIPEAPSVKKHGGRVCIMPVYEGHSTTHSIHKMKEK
jgi:D-beta-D-heptose 7-phosphate kinase/D-beta-D-heptose 1-phosphate adenosyltransferase